MYFLPSMGQQYWAICRKDRIFSAYWQWCLKELSYGSYNLQTRSNSSTDRRTLLLEDKPNTFRFYTKIYFLRGLEYYNWKFIFDLKTHYFSSSTWLFLSEHSNLHRAIVLFILQLGEEGMYPYISQLNITISTGIRILFNFSFRPLASSAHSLKIQQSKLKVWS